MVDPRPRTITFDFWNTLVAAEDRLVREQRRVDIRAAVEDRHGAFDDTVVERSLGAARRAQDAAWRANRPFSVHDAADAIASELGVALTEGERAAVIAAFVDPPASVDPPLAPNVGAALDALRAAGLRIGIVCDVGITPSSTLRRFLDGHGVLDRFDHWSFSDDVGVFKPDPVIVRHALDGLAGEPATHVHVGDLRRTDIAGANALGMTSVRYRGLFDDPGAPDDGSNEVHAAHDISDHALLATTLGLT